MKKLYTGECMRYHGTWGGSNGGHWGTWGEYWGTWGSTGVHVLFDFQESYKPKWYSQYDCSSKIRNINSTINYKP